MNQYTTLIQAIDPIDYQLKLWSGPKVPGISFEDAQEYCYNNGLGYCRVDGLFIGEVDETANMDEIEKTIDDFLQSKFN